MYSSELRAIEMRLCYCNYLILCSSSLLPVEWRASGDDSSVVSNDERSRRSVRQPVPDVAIGAFVSIISSDLR